MSMYFSPSYTCVWFHWELPQEKISETPSKDQLELCGDYKILSIIGEEALEKWSVP